MEITPHCLLEISAIFAETGGDLGKSHVPHTVRSHAVSRCVCDLIGRDLLRACLWLQVISAVLAAGLAMDSYYRDPEHGSLSERPTNDLRHPFSLRSPFSDRP